MFTKVVCVLMVYSSQGYEAREVRGTVLKVAGEYLVVDFQSSLRKLGADPAFQNYVQRVEENKCLYTDLK